MKKFAGIMVPALAAALGLGIFIYSGIRNRVEAESTLRQTTDQAAIPVVDVVHPQLAQPTQE